MANKMTEMNKIRKVIQFHNQGSSKLFISKYLSLSRNTVKKYIAMYQYLNLSLEVSTPLSAYLPINLTDLPLLQKTYHENVKVKRNVC